MIPPPAEALGRRVLEALELVEFGYELTELRLERDHPEASREEIRRLFEAWLRNRPADSSPLALPALAPSP